MSAFVSTHRKNFHEALLSELLKTDGTGIPNNADRSSAVSVRIAQSMIRKLGPPQIAEAIAGQTAGSKFEEICASYVEKAFLGLNELRPGKFRVARGRNISDFVQYKHLDELQSLTKNHVELATAIGSDYLITPDVVVFRAPEPDIDLNSQQHLVDETAAKLTPIRQSNSDIDILHASISCKWTLRSDRAQNARSEALNLVRNRKGHQPHIVAVTAEPTPGRVASLALGTGDIDCVYHIALEELRVSLEELGEEHALEMLMIMINGNRLRDISDLPLDLTI